MIIETIFSTLNLDGSSNFAPMGIVWNEGELVVRPFRDTRTCRNLLDTGYGVVNITDDVLAFVQCGLYHLELPHFPAEVVPGVIYQKACSWHEIRVIAVDGNADRAEVHCQIAHTGRRRDFQGFCRAQFAVLEAEILATRLQLGDTGSTGEVWQHYANLVEKTGGETEKIAIQEIQDYVRRWKQDDARNQNRS